MVDTNGKGQPKQAKGKAYRTSLATRLAVAVLGISIVSIVVTVLVSVNRISATAEDLIELRISARASALADELDAYFRDSATALSFIADSQSTAEAVTGFSSAYKELEGLDLATLEAERVSVGDFYLNEYIPALNEVRGTAVDPQEVSPRRTPAPIYLQANYIADSELLPSERRLLTDPDDGSAWTAVHTTFHPTLRSQVDGYGFLDLFLVDEENSAVVYSTNKDVAFGTGVISGPHSGTAMASLARRALTDGQPGDIFTADFSTYAPTLDQPSAFLASPVYDDDRRIGAVIVSMNLDVVTAIMTSDWRAGRFGETGEAYLVGPDRTMRSDSRLFLEDQQAYLQRIDDVGTIGPLDRSRMEALETTIIFQPVDNPAVRDALEGETDLITTTNYLGREVFSAFTPIGGDTFDWVLMVEQEVAEAEEPLTDYIQSVLTITVVFMVILTFGAVAWASTLVAPLRRMSAALQATRLETEPTPIPVTGVTEFRALAQRLNEMVDALVQRKRQVLAGLRAKTAVLRTLVPASAMAQVQVGERRFVETVPQCSVAVIKMAGIDALVREGESDTSRDFMIGLVEIADRIAVQHGLERVKLTGATYEAVCGLDTPHLDHAPRATGFASDCIRAMNRFAGESDIDFSVSGGVSSGTITAGLVGDSRLVFDLWGEPVNEADRLAIIAPADRIYVTAATMQRLPRGTELPQVTTAMGDSAWVIDVTGVGSEVSP